MPLTIVHLQPAHSSCSGKTSRCGRRLLSLPMNRWVYTLLPNCGQPKQGLFRCWLQVRPSSLATTPIRPSCHLSGCQLIIMMLMIFQLDSALNPDQGHGRFPTRPHHKGDHGRQSPVRPPSPTGQHGHMGQTCHTWDHPTPSRDRLM